MPRHIVALLIVLIAVLAPAGAGADQPFYYLNPNQLDLTILLPPPAGCGFRARAL